MGRMELAGPRKRDHRPRSGPCGLLPLQRAATAIAGLLMDISNIVAPPGDLSIGLWFQVAAQSLLLVAAAVAAFTLAASGDLRFVMRRPRSRLALLILLLGSVVFVAQSLQGEFARRFVVSPAWETLMALLLSAAAIVVSPRQFGAALLGGWAVGGISAALFELVYYYTSLPNGLIAIVVFGATLVACWRSPSRWPTLGWSKPVGGPSRSVMALTKRLD
jgi:hypothetical protein